MAKWNRIGLLGMLLSVASWNLAMGQDEPPPPPDGEATALDSWSGGVATYGSTANAPAQGDAVAYSTVDGSSPVNSQFNNGGRIRINNGYYSASLRGHFMAQWMYIIYQGRRHEFWGARIMHLDYDSPVRQLGVNPGDVLTRLDGIPVWRGMNRISGQPWQMPELDNHFGRTEVRFLLRGTNQVRVGDMMLDGTIPDGFDNGFPVLP